MPRREEKRKSGEIAFCPSPLASVSLGVLGVLAVQSPDCAAVLLECARRFLAEGDEERTGDGRVELRAAPGANFGERLMPGARLLIRLLGDHRGEGLRHGEDGGANRNLAPRQAVRL